jgi:hypothetical protein
MTIKIGTHGTVSRAKNHEWRDRAVYSGNSVAVGDS